MTAIKINDKKYYYASCYEELIVRHYIKICKWEPEKDVADRDYVKLLGILIDKDFASMSDTIENEITLIDAIGWVVFSQFEFSKEVPKVLKGSTWIVDVPTNIKALPIGQNIHVRREIEKAEVLADAIPMACAIYLQPLIDKTKFDLSRAKEIAKEIEEMPIYLIHPLGFFLLNHVLKPGNSSVKTWPQGSFNLSRILSGLSPKWRA